MFSSKTRVDDSFYTDKSGLIGTNGGRWDRLHQSILGSTHLFPQNDPAHQDWQPPVGASNLATAFLLFNSFVGTGILAFPFAFRCAGIAGGLGGLLVLGLMSHYTASLLLECKQFCNQTALPRVASLQQPPQMQQPQLPLVFGGDAQQAPDGTQLQQPFLGPEASWASIHDGEGLPIVDTYVDLAASVFGITGKRVVTCALLITQLGFCTVYAIFIIESASVFVTANRHFVLLCIFPVLLLLSFVPDTFMLAPLSKLGFAALMLATALICYSVYLVEMKFPWEMPLLDLPNLPLFFGIVCFCFAVHGVALPLQSRMQEPQEFQGVLDLVMLTVGMLYTVVGVVGYSCFGDLTASDVTNNLDELMDHNLVIALKAALIVYLLGIYALMMFPVTEAFDPSSDQPYTRYPKGISVLNRMLCVALTCVVGEIIPFYGQAISVLGALAVSFIIFIFPVACHLKLHWQRLSWRRRSLDFLVLFLGGICMLGGCVLGTSRLFKCARDANQSDCE
eukprot:gb/GEZN01004527.1/.p1 GENE.gb/GEZN01004527.1/~~gb/GEZN01004527.1/.p1  ORF type:complete len:507 (+),score=77.67 gb/GEZN01004527.1/:34-1554(+)